MSVRLSALCRPLVAIGVPVAVEAILFWTYYHNDATYHWFTHFFIGASTALLVMSVIAVARRRPVPFPLIWVVLAHLYAMTPDLLFADHIAHSRWMDIFLFHISSHYIPGGNWTWYAISLTALAGYLTALARTTPLVSHSRLGRVDAVAASSQAKMQ